MELYMLPYGPNGKAKLSISPIVEKPVLQHRNLLDLDIFGCISIGAPRGSYRLPHGPSGKGQLPIRIFLGCLHFCIATL